MSFFAIWISGIAGNLIASCIYDFIKRLPARKPPVRTPLPDPIAQLSICAVNDYDHPNENRKKLSYALERLAYRFCSLYCLYAGLAVPLMIKAMISHGDVMLSDARFVVKDTIDGRNVNAVLTVCR